MKRMRSSTRDTMWFAAGLALTLCAWGCEDDKDDPDHVHGDHDSDGAMPHSHDTSVKIGTPTGATCPKDSSLSYDSFGKDFMMKYCLRCHSESVKGPARNNAPSDHNFDTKGEIALLAPHIDQYAGAGPDSTNTKMPLGDPKPSEEERKKLAEWLACGAE